MTAYSLFDRTRLKLQPLSAREHDMTLSEVMSLDEVPRAPGAHRPGAFRGKSEGTMIEWGLHIGHQGGFLPFLERFDCQWR